MASRLKALGEYVQDSINGYRAASEAAQSTELCKAFERRLMARENTLDTINTGLAAQGDPQALSGSGIGTAHEFWTRVTSALDSSMSTIAARIEEGEKYLQSQFEKALDDHDLRGTERAVISQCYPEICDGARFASQLESTANA